MENLVWVGGAEVKSPEPWAVRGVVGGLTVLWGQPGCGKTFTGISLSVAVAGGKSWFGRKTRKGPVLYIVGEGGIELFKRRVIEAARDAGVGLDDLPMALWASAVDMSNPTKLEPLWPEWDTVSPVMVVVDTMSRCLPGDENKQETVQGFVGACDAIRSRYGASVLVLHHTNKQNMLRGSSVLPAAADVSIHTWRAADGHGRLPISFKPHKLKDLPTDDFEPKVLYPHVKDVRDRHGALVLDEYGDRVTTLVLRETPEARENVMKAVAEFERLAAGRDDLTCVGYREWLEACAATMSQATFKRAVGTILSDVDDWGIVQVRRGQYAHKGAVAMIAGRNDDVDEEAVDDGVDREEDDDDDDDE